MKRPSAFPRTISSPVTPQYTKKSSFGTAQASGLLTPPASPAPKAGFSNNVSLDYESLETLRSSLDAQRPPTYTNDNIIECPYEVDYVLDQSGQQQIFGRGAWSTVYKATCHAPSRSSYGQWTPPSHSIASTPLLVAVKSPTNQGSSRILRNEAKILTRLREVDQREEFVVAFHGIVDKTSAIVLNAYPTSFADYIGVRVKEIHHSTGLSRDQAPVIGSVSVWLDLAVKMARTLAWLHEEARIVHGDLKPANVVLRPLTDDHKGGFQFQPLLIDFSSSQRLDTNEITENTLSAVTTEYTAPELLSSSVLRNPRSCATPASDVFSLAVTLLVAATGELLVYPGCQPAQKLMYAMQGNSILNNIQAFSDRAPRRGIVGRALDTAVLKEDKGRITAKEWVEKLLSMEVDIQDEKKL